MKLFRDFRHKTMSELQFVTDLRDNIVNGGDLLSLLKMVNARLLVLNPPPKKEIPIIENEVAPEEHTLSENEDRVESGDDVEEYTLEERMNTFETFQPWDLDSAFDFPSGFD